MLDVGGIYGFAKVDGNWEQRLLAERPAPHENDALGSTLVPGGMENGDFIALAGVPFADFPGGLESAGSVLQVRVLDSNGSEDIDLGPFDDAMEFDAWGAAIATLGPERWLVGAPGAGSATEADVGNVVLMERRNGAMQSTPIERPRPMEPIHLFGLSMATAFDESVGEAVAFIASAPISTYNLNATSSSRGMSAGNRDAATTDIHRRLRRLKRVETCRQRPPRRCLTHA